MNGMTDEFPVFDRFEDDTGRETVFLRRLDAIDRPARRTQRAGMFPMTPSAARSETIRTLRRQMVANHETQSRQHTVQTGLSTLDTLLPDGGIPTGAILELISSRSGQFATSVALRSLRPLLDRPGCLAIIDERSEFYSIAAMAQGIPLSRLLLIRPPQKAEPRRPGSRISSASDALQSKAALWALEQTIRCRGVCAVLCWMDRSSTAVMRRLQLAVEQSGVTLVLVRPSSVLHQPSFADLRLLVTPVTGTRSDISHSATCATKSETSSIIANRSFSIRLLRSRHGLQHEGSATLFQTADSHRIFG